MIHSFTVELLHGLWKDGARHRLAVLRDPTGHDEAAFAEIGEAMPAERASRFIAGLIVRIGGCERPTLDEVLALTVGDRERLLLAVSARLLGQELSLVTTCPHCSEIAEISVRIADLIGPPAAAPDRIAFEAGDGQWRARIRPPTGADLERAAAASAAAARDLVIGCVVELVDAGGRPAAATALPPECESHVADALAELDRMAECRVDLDCPACAQPIGALIDGYTLLRAGLGEGENLYHDVFRMTHAYRWSEAEILSLPLARRRRYLAAAALHGMRP